MRLPAVAGMLAVSALCVPALAQPSVDPTEVVTAKLELSQQFYYAGDPLLVRISIGNNSGTPVANPIKSPLLTAFEVRGKSGALEARDSTAEQEPARPGKLAPNSFYGVVVDLAKVFPGLTEVGEYRIRWSAHGVSSDTLVVKMLPRYDPAKEYSATIETSMGSIVIEFLPDVSPIAVKAFIDMANAGYYDGLIFEEVHHDWYIVGGDPQYGSTPKRPLVYPAEQSTLPIVAGSVVMKPLRPAPPANGSQFMIMLRPEPKWVGQVTLLGQVVRGMDVVRKISRVPNSLQLSRPHFKPNDDVRIQTVKVTHAAEGTGEGQATGGSGKP